MRFSVIDKGAVGADTNKILAHLNENIDIYQPDMVVMMAGANDKDIVYYHGIAEAQGNIFRHFRVYRLLRLLYRHCAQKILKQGIHAKRMESDREFFEQGIEYDLQGKTLQAEQAVKKALELNPRNGDAYIELGFLYNGQSEYLLAEESFKKAVEADPRNDRAYLQLAVYYQNHAEFVQAEENFRKAIELNPDNDAAYAGLGFLYRDQGRFSEAEAAFAKAITINPRNDYAYSAASALFLQKGDLGRADEYARKADKVRFAFSSQVTVANYRRIKETLDARGIRLVSVQYPMRSVKPLQRMFRGFEQGVIFVDNEHAFKEAVRKQGYKEYFLDLFGGDFGHCTEKGNRLIAENIAAAILPVILHE